MPYFSNSVYNVVTIGPILSGFLIESVVVILCATLFLLNFHFNVPFLDFIVYFTFNSVDHFFGTKPRDDFTPCNYSRQYKHGQHMKCTSEPDDAGETDEYKRDAFQQRQVEHLCDDGTEMIQSIVVSVSH